MSSIIADMEVSAEYVAGIGWMYVLTKGGVLLGRYGNYETEAAALAAGRAASAGRP